jgi:hypothetical protein
MARLIIGILCILGAIVPPVRSTLAFVATLDSGLVFSVPGTLDVTIDHPGRWYLYHDHETLRDGEVLRQTPGLPSGTSLELTDDAGGVLPIAADPATITVKTGTTSSVSVAAWDLQPGNYHLAVTGDGLDAVCSFSEMRVMAFVKELLKSCLMSLLLIGLGIAGIVSGVSAIRQKRRAALDVLPDR